MAEEAKALVLASWLESELPADGNGMSVDAVAAELRRLHSANEALQATLNEADRRAGAAERELASKEDATQRQASWIRKAKAAAGYDNNISFDVVWDDALKALLDARGAKQVASDHTA